MFTGIIESIGSIRALTPKGGDVRVYVETGKLDLTDVKLGDSIAVNGVCLTAVELPGDGFWADVSRETLTVTAFRGQCADGADGFDDAGKHGVPLENQACVKRRLRIIRSLMAQVWQ